MYVLVHCAMYCWNLLFNVKQSLHLFVASLSPARLLFWIFQKAGSFSLCYANLEPNCWITGYVTKPTNISRLIGIYSTDTTSSMATRRECISVQSSKRTYIAYETASHGDPACMFAERTDFSQPLSRLEKTPHSPGNDHKLATVRMQLRTQVFTYAPSKLLVQWLGRSGIDISIQFSTHASGSIGIVNG